MPLKKKEHNTTRTDRNGKKTQRQMGRDVNKADLTGVRTAKQPSRETMAPNPSSERARHGFVLWPVEVFDHLLPATVPIIVFVSIGSYEAKSDYSTRPYGKL